MGNFFSKKANSCPENLISDTFIAHLPGFSNTGEINIHKTHNIFTK